MAISSEVRSAGPFVGDGTQTVFEFEFKVFDSTQIEVRTSDDGGKSETALDSDAYSCVLNEDQDTMPGGSVTLTTPLAEGVRLSILSDVPYTQPMVLTNRGGFYPEILNDSSDRSVILAQQNREILDRAMKVPSTSAQTPEEVVEELMSAQADAREQAEIAQAAADEAKAAAEETKEYAEAATVIEPLADELKTVADNIEDVTAVAGRINCVCTVAPYIEDVCTVAGINQQVVRVSQIQSEVKEVSLVTDEIKLIAENITTEELTPSDVDYGLITEQLDSADVDYGDISASATEADADYGNVMEAPEGGTVVVGGVIYQVGTNIEAVKDVAGAIENGLLAQILQAQGDLAGNVQAAQAAETNAESAAVSASGAADLAQKWAIYMDGPVEGADGYSAKHWASVASDDAQRAETAADAAADVADSSNMQMIEQMIGMWNAYYDDDLDYRDYLNVAQSGTLEAFYDFGRGYEGVTSV